MISNKFLLVTALVFLIIAGTINFALLYTSDFTAYERERKVKKAKNQEQLPKALTIMKEARKVAVKFYKGSNPMGVSAEKEIEQEQEQVQKIYKYTLTAIWYGEKTAIINGEILKEGDLLPDQISRVEKVLKNAVRINRVGRKVILRLEE